MPEYPPGKLDDAGDAVPYVLPPPPLDPKEGLYPELESILLDEYSGWASFRRWGACGAGLDGVSELGET